MRKNEKKKEEEKNVVAKFYNCRIFTTTQIFLLGTRK